MRSFNFLLAKKNRTKTAVLLSQIQVFSGSPRQPRRRHLKGVRVRAARLPSGHSGERQHCVFCSTQASQKRCGARPPTARGGERGSGAAVSRPRFPSAALRLALSALGPLHKSFSVMVSSSVTGRARFQRRTLTGPRPPGRTRMPPSRGRWCAA